MIGNTLQAGLDAIALGHNVTGAAVRAVWDKIVSGQPVDEGERPLAFDIAQNRPTLDALLAAEEAPNRTTLEQRAGNALAALETEAARDYSGLTTAQKAAALENAVKLLCRVCIALIRLVLRKLDSVQGTAKV